MKNQALDRRCGRNQKKKTGSSEKEGSRYMRVVLDGGRRSNAIRSEYLQTAGHLAGAKNRARFAERTMALSTTYTVTPTVGRHWLHWIRPDINVNYLFTSDDDVWILPRSTDPP